jgi:nucleoid-associated protein YgaU
MDHQEEFAAGPADRWRPAVVPLTATGLVLLERALMDEMGSPLMVMRTLGDLGRPWTDPVASVLAVMALTGELLVGYVAVVLVLGSLCRLPGSVGRLAARLTSLVTPGRVRRLLDLLVGGALLAQATLATAPGAPPGHRWSAMHLASTASSHVGSFVGPATVRDLAGNGPGTGALGWPVETIEPTAARPNPRRSAAPLPPWLGGGPSNAAPEHHGETGATGAPGHRGDATGGGARRTDDETAGSRAPRHLNERGGTRAPGHRPEAGGTGAPKHRDGTGGTRAPGHRDEPGGTPPPGHRDKGSGAAVTWHVVEVGDTLWDIAAARLVPAERSAVNINRYWRQVYRANRSVIGADPDLLHPGTRLRVSPFRRAR